jgi:hypothetical protein
LRKDGSTPLTSLHGPSGDAHIKPSLEKPMSSKICNCNARIAYGGSVVVSAVVIEDSLYDPTNVALRPRTASAILDGFGMASMEYGVDS